MAEEGKIAVLYRDSMPARLWWALWPKVVAIKQGEKILDAVDWDMAVELCQACVESWGFDGDPTDAAAYEALDFTDMATITTDAYNHVVELSNRRAAEAGE